MSTRERALWFVGPRAIELRDDPARAPGPREVVVRAIASGVSQGTEMLLYKGEGPELFDPSMGGGTYPRRYGYAWVGEVVGLGVGAEVALGERVFALVAHGDTHVLRDEDVRVLPADVPAARGVLAANLETAVTCTWDAGVGLGDEAVVLGGGVVGIRVSRAG